MQFLHLLRRRKPSQHIFLLFFAHFPTFFWHIFQLFFCSTDIHSFVYIKGDAGWCKDAGLHLLWGCIAHMRMQAFFGCRPASDAAFSKCKTPASSYVRCKNAARFSNRPYFHSRQQQLLTTTLLKYDDKISDTHFEEHFNEILTQSGNIIGNVVVGTFSSEC